MLLLGFRADYRIESAARGHRNRCSVTSSALSLRPRLIVNAADDTELTPMLTHVVAAAIVVPVVAARLDASRRLGVERPQNRATAQSCADTPGCTRFCCRCFRQCC
ncbi:DUF6069 family protein [Nocardia fluminea]|uniref:DUF6069 family protein n=1 Tax=Nocardia fluminea TaxID=134984 RepID=UPI003409A561